MVLLTGKCASRQLSITRFWLLSQQSACGQYYFPMTKDLYRSRGTEAHVPDYLWLALDPEALTVSTAMLKAA